MKKSKTPAEAKAHLVAAGISIADFARANDLDQATIYQVLAGRKKGLRGMAHKVAVALGIKALPGQ
ncbi:DNA-binding protein [Pseudomonas sp.]|uniref:DNA-binding protein n=1 Tax=Pseudomonas sp. TaxID=306 RepID=UPI003FD8AA8B